MSISAFPLVCVTFPGTQGCEGTEAIAVPRYMDLPHSCPFPRVSDFPLGLGEDEVDPWSMFLPPLIWIKALSVAVE